MLEHNETMLLIEQSQKGDESATSRLLEENKPLLKSIIRRYIGRSIEYDDLMQIGSVGLLKAIKNFSLEYNVRFSTYAVPMILGEVKRFIRDDGYIKVSRSIKSLATKINRYIEEYKKTADGNSEPTVEQISKEFNIDPADVAFTLDSLKVPLSIYEKSDDSDDKSLSLIDKLQTERIEDKIVDKVMLKEVINSLNPREKKIILLRYFRDQTQGEIASSLGVSQVQVSRLENKILEKIKLHFSPK